MKLSIAQSTMIRVIADNTGTIEGKPIPWYPHPTFYTENRQISIGGSGMGAALRALEKKGLLEHYPKLGRYSYHITDLGKKVAAEEKGKPLTFISCCDQQVLRERQIAAGVDEDY